MSTSIPAARMQLADIAPLQYVALYRFEESIELDPGLRHLVKLRASQLNGCAFCIDMHWKDARVAGESEERLYSLDAWRHSPLYDERERAALGLCEAITRLDGGAVPDADWEAAEAVMGEEVGQLVFQVLAINAWNRLAIATLVEPGHYEPGMWDTA